MDASVPKGPRETTGGIVWFARMLDKIRLHDAGRLPVAYVPNLGKGFDGRCVRFLRVDYGDLVRRTLEGGTDSDVLAWCFDAGRRLTDEDIEVWNGFLSKRGWRDGEAVTRDLEESKRADGLGGRADVVTFFDYDDADEGRA